VVKIKKLIAASKIMRSRPGPFRVTWRDQSRDHSTRGGRLPIGGPLWPCVYLAPLWRYGVSQVGRTDGRTHAQTSRATASVLLIHCGMHADTQPRWPLTRSCYATDTRLR